MTGTATRIELEGIITMQENTGHRNGQESNPVCEVILDHPIREIDIEVEPFVHPGFTGRAPLVKLVLT